MEALSVAVYAWDLLKEVAFIFITSTIVWLQVNSREGTQLHPPTEIWVKDLLKMALHIRTRPSFPPQSVSPIRKLPLKERMFKLLSISWKFQPFSRPRLITFNV